MENKEIFLQAQGYASDYADHIREREVFPTEESIKKLSGFMEEMPEKIGNASDILKQLHEKGAPGTVAQTGGRYFGFVNGGVIPTALAARILSDFWDQNVVLYVSSPISSKLEEVCETWLRDLFGLKEEVVAGFVSGSSMAIFCGLAAARYRICKNNNWDINKRGFNGAPRIRIITGRQIHGAVIKAISLLGFGIDGIEWVDTDSQGRIMASQIPKLDHSTILILQAGNVYTGSFDAFEKICGKAHEKGAWIHIDGAFGLWAAASERLRYLTKGIEHGNSWSVDGHKTLNTPYDLGIALCSDRDALIQALQSSGSYMMLSEKRDGMLYTPEMSRRSRGIDLWGVLKYLGREGLDELVFGLHERAVQMSRELAAAGFTILNDVVFNQVLVSCGDDETTNRTMCYIQESGECWVGGAEWDGKAAIRVSVCSWATTEADVSRSVRAFVAARNRVLLSLNNN